MLLFTIVIIVYSEYLIGTLKSNDIIGNDVFWITTIRYLIFTIMIYFVVAILYYFGIKKGKNIRFFSLGALITTLLFMLTTYFFGVYINNFSNYNELYGSIGALLIMMLYISHGTATRTAIMTSTMQTHQTTGMKCKSIMASVHNSYLKLE